MGIEADVSLLWWNAPAVAVWRGKGGAQEGRPAPTVWYTAAAPVNVGWRDRGTQVEEGKRAGWEWADGRSLVVESSRRR